VFARTASELVLMQVGITAAASYLPDRVLSTDELQEEIERASGFALPPNLIYRMTGIESRAVAGVDEYASTLAVRAAARLMAENDIDRDGIDLLIFASASRDMVEPATAHIVQRELGTRAHVFDLTNACNSLVHGVDAAAAFIRAGRARRALVVTGETPTRSMRAKVRDLADFRSSFAGFTFGDAGAAVLVEPVERGGILHFGTETSSEHWAVGGIPGGGSRHPRGDEHTYFQGNGHELVNVFRDLVVRRLDRLREETGLEWADYERVLVHQVTYPYLERFVETTGVPKEKLVITVPEHGNIASATLGVQLTRVWRELRSGSRTLFLGLGGGASVASMVWEKS